MRVRCKKDFVLIILEEVVVKWDYSVDGANLVWKCILSMTRDWVHGDLTHVWALSRDKCSIPPYFVTMNFIGPRYI